MCDKQRSGKGADFGELIWGEGMVCGGLDDGKKESEAGGIAVGFLLWGGRVGLMGSMGWEWGGRVRVLRARTRGLWMLWRRRVEMVG